MQVISESMIMERLNINMLKSISSKLKRYSKMSPQELNDNALKLLAILSPVANRLKDGPKYGKLIKYQAESILRVSGMKQADIDHLHARIFKSLIALLNISTQIASLFISPFAYILIILSYGFYRTKHDDEPRKESLIKIIESYFYKRWIYWIKYKNQPGSVGRHMTYMALATLGLIVATSGATLITIYTTELGIASFALLIPLFTAYGVWATLVNLKSVVMTAEGHGDEMATTQFDSDLKKILEI